VSGGLDEGPAIRLDGLRLSLGRREVLGGVTAAAPAAEVTALVGPNAVGKTTLLRAIAGVLTPAQGRIEVRSAEAVFEPHREPPRRRAAWLAYLPQQVRLPAGFTVEEVVAMGRYALPADPARIETAILRLDLGELRDRPVHALSAGQQQRTAIARCLAQLGRRGVLLLDEPFASLDLRASHHLAGVLRGMAAEGAAVLVSIHDLPLARRVASHAWLLESAGLAASGRLDTVLSPATLERLFGPAAAWVASDSPAPTMGACPEAASGSSS
jgi:ABC-type cobalamin/Fe3+-siderophores transport system ATPase subunit